MSQRVYASFPDVKLAKQAVGALMDKGVQEDHLSLVSCAAGLEEGETCADAEHAAKTGFSTTTPGDATAGAGKGAAIGLGVGVVATLVSIAVPGFGLVAGGGALATALAGGVGTTVGGAIAGGIAGYLKDQGVENHVAEEYARELNTDGALLAVELPSGEASALEVRETLIKYGARNVHAQETAVVDTMSVR